MSNMHNFCGQCANRNIFAVCFNCKGGNNYAPLEEEKTKSAKDCTNCKHRDSTASAEPCESCTSKGDQPPTNWEQAAGLYCLTEDCPYQDGMPCKAAETCGGYEGAEI